MILMNEDKSRRLFSGSDLRRLIIPLVIETTLTLIVGMIDSVMVSGAGEDAVSGVSLVDSLIQLLIYVFAALGTGGAVAAGQYLGCGDKDKACKSANQLIWFSGFVSVAVVVLLFVFKEAILSHLFGDITAEVKGCADDYLTVSAFSIPAIAIYESGAAAFRTMGNSKVTMWISLIMNIANISGNAAFIYGLEMGTAGAALATLISRYIAAMIISFLLLDQQLDLHLEKSFRYRPDRKIIGKILYIGVPNGFESGMFQLGKIIAVVIVAKFGTEAIAANAIANNIAGIQVIPGNSIVLAITTVISRCVGSGDIGQTRYYNRLLIKIMYISFAVIALSVFLCTPMILKLYNVSDKTADIAKTIITCHTFEAIAVWSPAFGLPASLRAAGDVKFTMIMSIVAMWVFRLGSALIFAFVFGLGAVSVWLAMLVDWIFRTIIYGVRWTKGKWERMKIV